jgi:hypothetical protein
MTPRARRILGAGYAALLALPFALLAVASRREIGVWLTTGMCPGGPMDRLASACGPATFFEIVFLGGWVAFLMVPLLLVWGLGWTLVFFAFLRSTRSE